MEKLHIIDWFVSVLSIQYLHKVILMFILEFHLFNLMHDDRNEWIQKTTVISSLEKTWMRNWIKANTFSHRKMFEYL